MGPGVVARLHDLVARVLVWENKMSMNHGELIARIAVALKAKDVSYAHVLLHSLGKVYNHTPYNVRYQRLEQFSMIFPTLIVCCLKSCSQTGKPKKQ